MKKISIIGVLMGAAMICATPISLNQSPDKGLSISLNSAEARIGRPLTLGSALLASTGECTAEHIAAARMVLLATKLCAIFNAITLSNDIEARYYTKAVSWRALSAGSVAIR